MQKVLIIEDSKVTNMYLSLCLKDDYDLVSANNAREGTEIIAEHIPDCIVSDLLMDEMDGFQLLEYLRQENIKIPTIIMSSDIQEVDKGRCLALGACAVLNKPVRSEELRKEVQKALATVNKQGC
ncbi:MAG: response regulator receiver protein [Candidatus Brocadiaceae bacterium]|nr:response regulator receiver protein [Candidatus Brocadiaceae bacterium]